MKILAIESSATVASVAVVNDNVLEALYTICHKITHSQTLMPMLDEAARRIELDKKNIDYVAVTSGPGSFTGLRIGASTAKGIAMGLNVPIVPVPTLEALAFNAYGVEELICPVMDARRNQVYTGIYSFERTGAEYRLITHLDQTAMDLGELVDKLNSLGKSVLFMGDAKDIFAERIEAGLKCDYAFAPVHMNRQSAAALASAAVRKIASGEYVSAGDFAPTYLRLSQAEREAKEKGNN